MKIREITTVYKTTDKVNTFNEPIVEPKQVVNLFLDLQNETKEKFIAVHLDTKNKITCFEVVSVGTLNASLVHPREVFKSALLSNANSMVLIHNHPSGNTTPSKEDIDLTKRLKAVGDLLGVPILDHLIVGDNNKYYSFQESGNMKAANSDISANETYIAFESIIDMLEEEKEIADKSWVNNKGYKYAN